MKALVTGAAGFVGRHLVAHLEACGDDVDGVDRARRARPARRRRRSIDARRATSQPDAVYHLGRLERRGRLVGRAAGRRSGPTPRAR